MKRWYFFLIAFFLAAHNTGAQSVTIQVNANEGRRAVSPYIYGRNNNFSDNPSSPTSASNISLYKEAGLRLARENGGNNATKYNWRRKISSHPDWYNNVYSHDWDYASQAILAAIPQMQTMWAFQLIGKTASNKNNNFNDWGYNGSQWWSGVAQNLAGGGVVNPAGGSHALADGNPDLYLMSWPADSTTKILTHWFRNGGLGLPQQRFLYWSMDNEPEIWNGTHDDIMHTQLSAADFMNLYFAVAKKARERFPDIKLTGPVPANEWQWYKWGDESLNIDGNYYCWLEYFIKRVADEQKATGIRLLDVLDIHWYPGESSGTDIVQMYRVFYDKTYTYPGANGVKTINGGWDGSITKEYIFQRINDWLVKYFGENHGITLALTETAINSSDANIISVAYASMLGTFANNGVEIFTPWSWKTGMWETLHLFSRYAKNNSVSSESTLDASVSGYTTINSASDSMTVILVNRDLSSTLNTTVNISGFSVPNGSYTTKRLSTLPSSETFISHTSNALKSSTVNVSGNSFTISLPALSTTAVILKGTGTGIGEEAHAYFAAQSLRLYPNPAVSTISVDFKNDGPLSSDVVIFDLTGRRIESLRWTNSGQSPLTINVENYTEGIYFVRISNDIFTRTLKFFVVR